MINKNTPGKTVNLSTTFPTRNRCKKCGKVLSSFYSRFMYSTSFNIEYLKRRSRDANRRTQKFTNIMDHFYGTKYMNFSLTCRAFNLPLFRLHKSNTVKSTLGMVSMASCDCGSYSIAFNDSEQRIDITSRKSRNHYPQKLKSFW